MARLGTQAQETLPQAGRKPSARANPLYLGQCWTTGHSAQLSPLDGTDSGACRWQCGHGLAEVVSSQGSGGSSHCEIAPRRPSQGSRGVEEGGQDEDAEDRVVVFLTVLWSWQGAWPFQCLRFPIFKVGSHPHEAQMWKALTEKLWINVNL